MQHSVAHVVDLRWTNPPPREPRCRRAQQATSSAGIGAASSHERCAGARVGACAGAWVGVQAGACAGACAGAWAGAPSRSCPGVVLPGIERLLPLQLCTHPHPLPSDPALPLPSRGAPLLPGLLAPHRRVSRFPLLLAARPAALLGGRPFGLPAACKPDPFSTLCMLSCQLEHLLRVSQPRPKLFASSSCHADERLALLSSLAKGGRAATVLLERSNPPSLLLRSGSRPRSIGPTSKSSSSWCKTTAC